MAAPTRASLTIVNATVPLAVMGSPESGATQKADVSIVGGVITAIGPAGSAAAAEGQRIDADGGLLLPSFVDMHTHLDKGHIWPRRASPDGTWLGALNAVQADRETHWAASDVERRMDFSLRCAYANGTAAVRTHLDSAPPQHEITWDVFSEVRSAWAGRIELQACSIIGPDTALNQSELEAVAKTVAAHGGILGGSIAVHPEARKALFNTLETAGKYGLSVDLHIDETVDPESSALLHLADAVIETGFTAPVNAGHCCVIAVQDPAIARKTIDRVAQAGISIVSLPMCNMYLMNRDPSGTATPIRRGPTLVKELAAAGVTVAMASDNTRDPFYAYGDLDMLEVYREATRILQFDHSERPWLKAVAATPGEVMGLPHGRMALGAPAGLVLTRARTMNELLSRPQTDRVVLCGGKQVDRTLPDYRELD